MVIQWESKGAAGTRNAEERGKRRWKEGGRRVRILILFFLQLEDNQSMGIESTP